MAKKSTPYAEKLKDPRWQKMRLVALNRDDWACSNCGDKTKTLHVHHGYYEYGKDPWDYPLCSLRTLCEDCHTEAESLKDWFKKYFATKPLGFQYSIHNVLLAASTMDTEEGECEFVDCLSDMVTSLMRSDQAGFAQISRALWDMTRLRDNAP